MRTPPNFGGTFYDFVVFSVQLTAYRHLHTLQL